MPALKSSIVGEPADEVVSKAEFEGISLVDFLNLLHMSKEAPPASPDTERASHHGHKVTVCARRQCRRAHLTFTTSGTADGF